MSPIFIWWNLFETLFMFKHCNNSSTQINCCFIYVCVLCRFYTLVQKECAEKKFSWHNLFEVRTIGFQQDNFLFQEILWPQVWDRLWSIPVEGRFQVLPGQRGKSHFLEEWRHRYEKQRRKYVWRHRGQG